MKVSVKVTLMDANNWSMTIEFLSDGIKTEFFIGHPELVSYETWLTLTTTTEKINTRGEDSNLLKNKRIY